MLTFTGLRNLYGKITHDKSTENLATFDTLSNEIIRGIVSSGDYSWREKEKIITTVADQQGYELFNDLDKLSNVYHLVDSQKHVPLGEITSKEQWNALNTTSVSSDIPEWHYVFGGKIKFYPTPASSSNSIYVSYLRKHIELSNADYTTGTIASIANGDTTVTGDSTVWTSVMVGRYIQLTDKQWYEIDSVTDNTHLELVKDYMGTSVAAASDTYTIGECSMLPEESQILPVYEAAEIYFTSINPDVNKATLYKKLKVGKYVKLKKEKSSGVKLTKGNVPITNPQKYYSV